MKKETPNSEKRHRAEAFVDTANLSKYDPSEMMPVRFKMKHKDNLRALREKEKSVTKRSADVSNGSNWK
jgi:hypothetical protein